MMFYKGLPIDSAGAWFQESDVSFDLMSMDKATIASGNSEGFTAGFPNYPVVDYFPFDGVYFSYIYNVTAETMGHRVAFYDKNKTYISTTQYFSFFCECGNDEYHAKTIRVPEGTAYIRMQYKSDKHTYLHGYNGLMASVDDINHAVYADGYADKISSMLGIANKDSNPFWRKSVICIGDSITENNKKNDNKSWAEYLADVLGMKVFNAGKSGTGLIKGDGAYKSFCNRVDLGVNSYPTITPDMVLIMGNGNDATGGTYYDYAGNAVSMDYLPVGTASDTADQLTVYGAVRHILDALVQKYPLAKIGWIISTPRKQSLGTRGDFSKAGGTFDQYTDAIKEVCGEYGVPVLDLFHNSQLRPHSEPNAKEFFYDYILGYGYIIHPNSTGVKECMVRPIAQWMLNNF